MDHFLVVPGRKGKTRSVMSLFRDRVDAGRHLADVLLAHAGLGGGEVVVLGLPRGGVPVAAVVGRALGAPLDVILVRKLGVPSQPELAMGAIGEDGVLAKNVSVMEAAAVTDAYLEASARGGNGWSSSGGPGSIEKVAPAST